MDFFLARTASTIKMVIWKNIYVFCLNPKTNCWLGTISAFYSRDSKGVLYVLICNNCDFFFIGQSEKLKQGAWKHKSYVIHSNNNNCKNCSEHLKTSRKMKEPYFNIYSLLFEEYKYLRKYKERHYKCNVI